jgi:hypothetical protein
MKHRKIVAIVLACIAFFMALLWFIPATGDDPEYANFCLLRSGGCVLISMAGLALAELVSRKDDDEKRD